MNKKINNRLYPLSKDEGLYALFRKKAEFNEKLFKYALLFAVFAAGVGIIYLMKKRK